MGQKLASWLCPICGQVTVGIGRKDDDHPWHAECFGCGKYWDLVTDPDVSSTVVLAQDGVYTYELRLGTKTLPQAHKSVWQA